MSFLDEYIVISRKCTLIPNIQNLLSISWWNKFHPNNQPFCYNVPFSIRGGVLSPTAENTRRTRVHMCLSSASRQDTISNCLHKCQIRRGQGTHTSCLALLTLRHVVSGCRGIVLGGGGTLHLFSILDLKWWETLFICLSRFFGFLLLKVRSKTSLPCLLSCWNRKA